MKISISQKADMNGAHCILIMIKWFILYIHISTSVVNTFEILLSCITAHS